MYNKTAVKLFFFAFLFTGSFFLSNVHMFYVCAICICIRCSVPQPFRPP